jgi:uncharacterized protein YeaO (DUF488 family)
MFLKKREIPLHGANVMPGEVGSGQWSVVSGQWSVGGGRWKHRAFSGTPFAHGTIMIRLQRVYDKGNGSGGGTRILVERLWPRGLSKQAAGVDLWLRDLAPSTDLREWFNHDPDKWPEFRRRYWRELKDKSDLVKLLKHVGDHQKVTFVYAAADTEHNSAVALREFLQRQAG